MQLSDDRVTIEKYLKKYHVLTLCAAAGEDLWCANCFYVVEPGQMALLLMTDLKTRHGALMAQQPRVSGTIAAQPKTVALIKGVQYSGRAIQLVGEEEQAGRALYCKQFPVARAMPSPVWRLSLDEIKMTDNTLGFGKKLFWQRENRP
ncbi:YhbP family protein [Chimaeribacter arupi]|uniref:UPF0306 protein CYR34_16210 n=1 Tax=Chimaeribacter arupi TaxID=2060066 RepID=A0A2N5EJQ5_9GAMM|nr:YhbP family protein [Chimaeribacter arupi]PLR34875.1 hypothetical protein CYR23_09460 [Chimaeribacter arupi]PLR46173.1 hypothetical protein CYR34_16210 [Chimaeribacter arupi]PLR52915.1 hypothetical protein CYR52_05860 [Chimaeribacter arupi]